MAERKLEYSQELLRCEPRLGRAAGMLEREGHQPHCCSLRGLLSSLCLFCSLLPEEKFETFSWDCRAVFKTGYGKVRDFEIGIFLCQVYPEYYCKMY